MLWLIIGLLAAQFIVEVMAMSTAQDVRDRLTSIEGKVGNILNYVRGIAEDLKNPPGGDLQAAVDEAVTRLDALGAAVDAADAEKTPDPTP